LCAPPKQRRRSGSCVRSIPERQRKLPIPDPYYGADADFDEVLALCRVACRYLLQEIRAEHRL